MGRPTNAALRERIAELEAELEAERESKIFARRAAVKATADHDWALAKWNEEYGLIDAELQDAWKIIRACANSPACCQLCQKARDIRRCEQDSVISGRTVASYAAYLGAGGFANGA
jgi:hypothetical protein